VALADVMAVITHQACRWHSFSVSSDTAEDLQTILRRLSNISAPFLTSLSFSYHTPPSYLARSENLRPWIEHGSYARILKGGAPLLSEVQLNGVMLPFCWPPLGAVERLCLDDGNGLAETEDVFLSYHQLRTALTASSSLDELSLSGCILHTWSTHQVPPISTPNLTVLSLHIDVLHLLFEFEAPRLRHLTLFDAFDEQFESVDDSALGVSGQGRFPALQSLNYITADVLGYRTWAIFFKACPSITDVSFSASKFSAEVALQRLGNFNIDAEPWPSLQTVTFFHSLPQPGILNGMLLHRIAIGLPLAKVRLGCELASTVGMSPLEVQIAPQIVEMHPQSWLKHHGIDEDQ
jgi:hypothetical protein